MACFLVPTTEAIITTAVRKGIEIKTGKKSMEVRSDEAGITVSDKIKWLENMLWGGSALLAFEHVWHGEVVPFFPFLTAAKDPEAFSEMLHEMSTTGVSRAIVVTLVWGIMVGVSSAIEKGAFGKRGKNV